MSYMRIILVDADVEGPGATDAVIATLRELLGKGSNVIVGVDHVDPVTSPTRVERPAPVIYEPSPPRPQPAPVARPAASKPATAAAPRRTFAAPPPLVRPDREAKAKSAEQPAPVAATTTPPGQLSIADRVVAMYRANLAVDRHELARAVYGDSTQATMINLQQVLQRLCSTGRLKRVSHGRYELP